MAHFNQSTDGLARRRFLTSAAALAGASALGIGGAAAAAPLPFRFAYSAISWESNIEEAIKAGARLGMPGIEPFRQNVVNYLDKPLALKKLMDDAGIRMVSCSNGGGPDFSGNFYDPAKYLVPGHYPYRHPIDLLCCKIAKITV